MARVPEALLTVQREITITSYLGSELLQSTTYTFPGEIEFRSPLPPAAAHQPILVIDFAVDTSFAPIGDKRELGILIPHDPSASQMQGSHFLSTRPFEGENLIYSKVCPNPSDSRVTRRCGPTH